MLERLGALDGTHGGGGQHPQRVVSADLARGQAELDSFDFIEDLKIARGPLLSVLTGTSLHGALPDAGSGAAQRKSHA